MSNDTFKPETKLNVRVITWALTPSDAGGGGFTREQAASASGGDTALQSEMVEAYNRAHAPKGSPQADPKTLNKKRARGEIVSANGKMVFRTEERDFTLQRGKGHSWEDQCLDATIMAVTIEKSDPQSPLHAMDMTDFNRCSVRVVEIVETVNVGEYLKRAGV